MSRKRSTAKKAPGPLGSGLGAVCVLLGFVWVSAGNSFAAWAAHLIVDQASQSTVYPISVRLSDDQSKVRIFLPANSEDQLGYFLIRAKKRQERKDLEFRTSMWRWKHYERTGKKARDDASEYDRSAKAREDGFDADVERFEEMKRLLPETRDGVQGIFVELEKEAALRTYIVYDFLPWGGSGVRDGGYWLTYDVPSFVEALPTKAGAEKVCGPFRVKNVLVESSPDGGKSFRVQIEKFFQGWPKVFPGIRPRIWEKTPEGSLVIAEPVSPPEYEMMPKLWKDGETADLMMAWAGPKPGSGNTYYGFSVDIVLENRVLDSWGSSSELLTHLLATERMKSDKLQYQSRPSRIFIESRRKLAEIRKNTRPESRVADVQAVKKIAETLATLVEKYPDWEHSDTMAHDLREARNFLAQWEKE